MSPTSNGPPQHSGPRTVLVVDDHPIVRRGLASVLSVEPWVGAVHEASGGPTAVRLAVTEHVDVVSMDLRLHSLPSSAPGMGSTGAAMDGIETTRALLRARPEAAVLILTMVLDEVAVADALSAGARGYLLKSTDPADVVDALHLVANGGVVLGAGVGPDAFRAHPAGDTAWPAPFDQLTDRERRLAQLVASGLSNARIAREMEVSDKTVRNQVSALLVRLSVPDRVAVALLARDRGFGAE